MQFPKQFYGKTILQSEELMEETPIELEYYATKDESNSDKIYGIGITKKCTSNDEVSIEQKEINHITEQEKEVKQLLKILLKNKVTPICLKDVLQDFVEAKHQEVSNTKNS